MTRRSQRRVAWLVIVVSAAYLAGWAAVTIQRERNKAVDESVKTLHADAYNAAQAGDYDKALSLCCDLQKHGPKWAHAVRGLVFEKQGKTAEARIEYQASYDLGNHVAGGSAARLAAKGGG